MAEFAIEILKKLLENASETRSVDSFKFKLAFRIFLFKSKAFEIFQLSINKEKETKLKRVNFITKD